MLLGLEPRVDTDCNKGNGKRGKAYLTDGVTVQPPHSNGKAAQTTRPRRRQSSSSTAEQAPAQAAPTL